MLVYHEKALLLGRRYFSVLRFFVVVVVVGDLRYLLRTAVTRQNKFVLIRSVSSAVKDHSSNCIRFFSQICRPAPVALCH